MYMTEIMHFQAKISIGNKYLGSAACEVLNKAKKSYNVCVKSSSMK